MFLVRAACLLLASSAVLAQEFGDSTIPSDYDEELEDSSTHIPKFISKSISIEAKEGETVTFPCEVDDLGKFSTVWKKGKTHIFADTIRLLTDKNFVRMDNSSLQIRRIRGNYSGDYSCVISHTPVLELTHHLTVLVRPRVHLYPKSAIVVKKGQTLELNCNATGSPLPKVSWRHLETVPGMGDKNVHEGAILMVSSVDRMDGGAYECKAENGVGEPATSIAKVQVLYAPEIELKANWVHSGVGVTTDLECIVHAEPQAHVSWQKSDGRIIKSDQHFITKSLGKSSHSLRIRKVNKEDFGNYVCMATNSIGSVSETIEVSGLASPVIFKSDPNGDKPNTFILTWETNSYARVIEYLLKIRIQDDDGKVNDRAWTEVNIPAESQSGALHSHTYDVTGLEGASTYEAIMMVRNEIGWNNPSDGFLFSTEGKAVVPPSLEESSVMSAEQGEESSTLSEATFSTLLNGSTAIPVERLDVHVIRAEAHPHPQQGDDSGAATPPPKSARIFSLLTVIILSFFF